MPSTAAAAAIIASTLAWLPWLPLLPSAVDGQQNNDTSTSCQAPVNPRGVGVHEDGSLYVLDAGVGILAYNSSNGVFLGIFADTEAEGGLSVSLDAIFVSAASATSGTVEVFDLDANLAGTFPAASSDRDAPPGGYDVAVDAAGDVYVSNFLEDGVEVYDGATGEYLRQILGDTRALGIAFGPDGLLYAAINGDNEVRRFEISAEGNSTVVEAFINGGSGSNTRVGPWGVAVNQEDYLIYVCWADSKELTEYSQSGAELRWWVPGQDASATVAGGTGGSDAGDDDGEGGGTGGGGAALSPWYVAVDDAGDVYVTATDEDGVEADVLKYDGTTGDEIGRVSECAEGTFADSSASGRTADPSAAPSMPPTVPPFETPASPLTTDSPAATTSPLGNPTPPPTPPPTPTPTPLMPSGTPAEPSTAPPDSLEPTAAAVATFSPVSEGETRSPAATLSPVSRSVETETPAPTLEAADGSTASPALAPSSPDAATEAPVGEGEEASASNGAGAALHFPGFVAGAAAAVLFGAIAPYVCMV